VTQAHSGPLGLSRQEQPPASHIGKHRIWLAAGHDDPTVVNASQRSKGWPVPPSVLVPASVSPEPFAALLHASSADNVARAAHAQKTNNKERGTRGWLLWMSTRIVL
jgi:hypothetical protein